MPQINLVWSDANNQPQAYQFALLETDADRTLTIGRDYQKCELLLAHNTVSRVHAEISFKSEWQRFYLRNLAAKNPVRIDGGLLTDGEVAIYQGSMIQLGQILLNVSEVLIGEVAHIHAPPPTPVAPISPQPLSQTGPTPSQSPNQPYGGQPAVVQAQASQPPANQSPANQSSTTPKLVCPKCQTLQLMSLRNSNCPVCGHFLADAASRYFF